MERTVRGVPDMYTEMMILLKMQGRPQSSRNGGVLALQEPLTITVEQPWHRVLLDPVRDCNPFFHLAEFVWMMAGSKRVDWIVGFNSRFAEYADDDEKIHGAYGHRWRRHFGYDQIFECINLLKRNHSERRVVLGMWDPENDLGTSHNDLPCNTHIYLRIINESLEMTVCNRSNDVVWGMTGANIVHMTLLHELMARAVGVHQGLYRVFTNNAHVYPALRNVDKMLNTTWTQDMYSVPTMPVLAEDEDPRMFVADCEFIVAEEYDLVSTGWLLEVAIPAIQAYRAKFEGWGMYAERIVCPQWRKACIAWLHRKRL